jgi:lipid-binding SYLF domain-containing protein
MHSRAKLVSKGPTLVVAAVLWLCCAGNPVLAADWQPAPGNRLEERAAQAKERIYSQVARSHPYFEDAYAYAIWPGITRIAVGFGGAYGKGLVIEQGRAVGTVSYWQLSSGIQGGAKHFAMIIFFKNKAALEGLQRGDIQFTGQAGIDIATFGAAGTPAYNEGVSIIPLTNFGLMAEFSAAGVKYRYKPYERGTTMPQDPLTKRE